SIYSPYFYSSIASQADNKILISLNYNGDILIFYKKQLLFSKRRGYWKFYQFDAIIRQVSFENKYFSEPIRKEIILTCLDVSFAKSGGCIAYINKKNESRVREKLNVDDIVSLQRSTKTKVLY